MELKKEIEEVLKKMKIKGVAGSIVARSDGLLVASYMPLGIDSKLLAALAAAIVKSSIISSKEMGMGKVENVLLKASKGYYVCFPVDEELILASLLEKDANVGMVLLNTEKMVKEIVKLLRLVR